MLLKRATLEGIRSGAITLAFRRWKRPTVKAGGRLRTAIGELAIHAIEPIAEAQLTGAAARAAGYSSVAELRAALADRPGTLYRVRLSYAGTDRRITLSQQAALDASERAAIAQRLARMDARSQSGPWTARYLQLIARHPGVRAPDLAAEVGLATQPFKARVRRLKELGLTHSLDVGYRLSPRGEAFLQGEKPATHPP